MNWPIPILSFATPLPNNIVSMPLPSPPPSPRTFKQITLLTSRDLYLLTKHFVYVDFVPVHVRPLGTNLHLHHNLPKLIIFTTSNKQNTNQCELCGNSPYGLSGCLLHAGVRYKMQMVISVSVVIGWGPYAAICWWLMHQVSTIPQ